MSARKAVYVRRFAAVDGGKSPNAYVPQITVEIRVFIPPYLGHEERAQVMLAEAYVEAVDRLAAVG